jgi:hypothetical protein
MSLDSDPSFDIKIFRRGSISDTTFIVQISFTEQGSKVKKTRRNKKTFEKRPEQTFPTFLTTRRLKVKRAWSSHIFHSFCYFGRQRERERGCFSGRVWWSKQDFIKRRRKERYFRRKRERFESLCHRNTTFSCLDVVVSFVANSFYYTLLFCSELQLLTGFRGRDFFEATLKGFAITFPFPVFEPVLQLQLKPERQNWVGIRGMNDGEGDREGHRDYTSSRENRV